MLFYVKCDIIGAINLVNKVSRRMFLMKTTLCFIKPLSFTTFLRKAHRKKKVYELSITVSAERPEKYVWGTVHETKNGRKICFEKPNFGVFNIPIARMVARQIAQNKSTFDFVKILPCEVRFRNWNSHHVKVYNLNIMEPETMKSVSGRVYKNNGDTVIVFDKPSFGVLTPLIADSLLHELAREELD